MYKTITLNKRKFKIELITDIEKTTYLFQISQIENQKREEEKENLSFVRKFTNLDLIQISPYFEQLIKEKKQIEFLWSIIEGNEFRVTYMNKLDKELIIIYFPYLSISNNSFDTISLIIPRCPITDDPISTKTKGLITTQEIEKLYNELKPLEDGVKVEKVYNVKEYDNAYYVGEFKYIEKNNQPNPEMFMEIKHGRGILVWHNNGTFIGKYMGYYINNKASIKGTMISKDVNYNGQMKNGKREGKGECIFNEEKYEGEWKEGSKNGKGKIEYSNKDSYLGMFKDNKRWGKGKYDYNDGSQYIGDWVNNMRHGYGEFTDIEKNIYKGKWYKDKKEGEGNIYNFTEDKWRKGIWKKDECIELEDKTSGKVLKIVKEL